VQQGDLPLLAVPVLSVVIRPGSGTALPNGGSPPGSDDLHKGLVDPHHLS